MSNANTVSNIVADLEGEIMRLQSDLNLATKASERLSAENEMVRANLDAAIAPLFFEFRHAVILNGGRAAGFHETQALGFGPALVRREAVQAYHLRGDLGALDASGKLSAMGEDDEEAFDVYLHGGGLLIVWASSTEMRAFSAWLVGPSVAKEKK